VLRLNERQHAREKEIDMPNQPDKHLRAQLPIPEVPRPGLTTYDAKDPDTTYLSPRSVATTDDD
jgi:hypothetical protein